MYLTFPTVGLKPDSGGCEVSTGSIGFIESLMNDISVCTKYPYYEEEEPKYSSL